MDRITQPKAAIVASDYHVPGETFINRHIAHMFGGNTCVIAGRCNGQDPYGKPVFERRAPLSLVDTGLAPFAMGWNLLRHHTSRLPFGAARRDLRAFLRDQRVDIILAEFGTQALVIADLAQEMGLPAFTYFRGTDASRALRSARMIRAYLAMMPRLTGVFSVSQFLLDNLAAHGITHPNAHVMPSGVDIRRFTPGDKVPESCLAVGRMVEKKAPLVTLRAFASAAAEREAHLTFVGDGPLLDPARDLARELGVAERVTFTGALPHDQVRDLLTRTEIFLQHSVTAKDGNTEGLPTAIQEAMSAGCITVSTRHAGIPEAVTEGVTGYLVDEWDETGFAAALARVLDSPDRPTMAQTARDHAIQRFDNDVLLARTETILRTALRQT